MRRGRSGAGAETEEAAGCSRRSAMGRGRSGAGAESGSRNRWGCVRPPEVGGVARARSPDGHGGRGHGRGDGRGGDGGGGVVARADHVNVVSARTVRIGRRTSREGAGGAGARAGRRSGHVGALEVSGEVVVEEACAGGHPLSAVVTGSRDARVVSRGCGVVAGVDHAVGAVVRVVRGGGVGGSVGVAHSGCASVASERKR